MMTTKQTPTVAAKMWGVSVEGMGVVETYETKKEATYRADWWATEKGLLANAVWMA